MNSEEPLCIIPARGGSKRIPRKNIKPFLGKPIIYYPISVALESGIFDKVIVSTDDEEIRDVAVHFGASVPFLRSEENSGDSAHLVEVLLEVCENLGVRDAYICCVLPTAPFITAEVLRATLAELKANTEADCLVPIVQYDYPVPRSFRLENGFVTMRWPENYSAHSQDLEPFYHDAGAFYWIRIDSLRKHKRLFTPRTIGYQMDARYVQDIDTPEDWKIAEMKYRILKNEQ